MQLAGNKIAMLNLTNRTVLAQIQYQEGASRLLRLHNQPGTPKLNVESPSRSTLETTSPRRGEGRRGGSWRDRGRLPLAGAVRKRGEDNERVVAMAPPSSALRPHSSPVV